MIGASFLLGSLALVAAQSVPATAPSAPIGRYLWFGVWPDRILVFDTQRDEVVQSIPLRRGVPFDFALTRDRRRLFVVTDREEGFEIVDVDRREVVDDFRLSTDDRIVRIDGIAEMPGGKRVLLSVNPVKKEADRFVIEKKEVWLYDLAKREAVKTWKERDLPREVRRARLFPSADGRELYALGRDLAVVDPETLKVVEKRIELGKPLYPGFGAVRPSSGELFDFRDADRATFLYRSRDPVRKKSAVGLVVLDLKAKTVADFGEVGPAFPAFRPVATHDRKKLYVHGNDRLYEVDLEARRIARERELKLEPRRWLMGISADGKRLYVGGAGERWDIHSTETLEKTRTISFAGDLATEALAMESGPP